MIFLRQIKKTYASIARYFKHRAYRKKVLSEKSRQYLFRASEKKPSFFSLYFSKKKTLQFANTFLHASEKYRYPFFSIGAFLLLACTYILFISPYFRIAPSKVLIERTDTITDINIAYKSIENIYGQSIFFMNEGDVANMLVSLQKNIKTIDISRLYPNGLKIILQSYQPQFVTAFAGSEKKYILTSNGVLIYDKNPSKKLFPIDIVDPTFVEIGFFDYKEGITEQYMQRIVTARDTFFDRFTGVNISRLTYFKVERELHISLESGVRIILELTEPEDITRQLAALRFYVDQHKDVLNLGEVAYIDIRNIGKIFICNEK